MGENPISIILVFSAGRKELGKLTPTNAPRLCLDWETTGIPCPWFPDFQGFNQDFTSSILSLQSLCCTKYAVLGIYSTP